jgi:hypothetical protein
VSLPVLGNLTMDVRYLGVRVGAAFAVNAGLLPGLNAINVSIVVEPDDSNQQMIGALLSSYLAHNQSTIWVHVNQSSVWNNALQDVQFAVKLPGAPQ